MRQAATRTSFCFYVLLLGFLWALWSSSCRPLCVVCLCGAGMEEGGGGVMINSRGVAFELFEVAVVGIGILFASKRHERD